MNKDPKVTRDRTANKTVHNQTQVTKATSLLMIWRRINQAMATRLSSHGLPSSMAAVLLLIHTNSQESEPARLADQMHFPRQTMTFILDALERMKLAHRKPHPIDRRKKIIVNTSKGTKLAQTILDDLLRYETEAANATFSPQEIKVFSKATVKLADTLEHLNTPGVRV